MDRPIDIPTHIFITLGLNILPDATLFPTPPVALGITVDVAAPVALAIVVEAAPPPGRTALLEVLLAVVEIAVFTTGVA